MNKSTKLITKFGGCTRLVTCIDMDASLLDTDILSEVIKQRNHIVLMHAATYLQQFARFELSAITRYEIRRGYLNKKATTLLPRFENFCRHSSVLQVTDNVLDLAALLWVDAQQGGHTCGDADLIIAATALERKLVLVTGNTRHFAWISGLTILDWRQP